METENIDLFVIIEKLWRRKKVVFAWMGGCLAVGIALIFLLPRQYRAECMMQWDLPEGLPQVAPSLYPDLFYSDAFLEKLMHRPLCVEDSGDTLTYFLAVTGKPSASAAGKEEGLTTLTPDEQRCIGQLRKEASVALNMNERLLTVMVESRDPKLAALLAEQARLLLQQTVSEEGEKSVSKAFGDIEKRYLKMKAELNLRQQQLVEALEKAASLPAVRREVEKKIQMEDYDLFYSLYSECVCDYEKARIKYRENRTVLTVIRPVVEPVTPCAPRPRLLVLASLFLGFLCGCGWVLLSACRRS